MAPHRRVRLSAGDRGPCEIDRVVARWLAGFAIGAVDVFRIAAGRCAAAPSAEDQDAGHEDRDNADDAGCQHCGDRYPRANGSAFATGPQAIAWL